MSRTLLRCAALGCAAYLIANHAGPASAQRRNNSAEQAIEAALASPAIVSAERRPLPQMLEELAERHGIPIALNAQAIEESGVSPSVEVTCDLTGVSLEAVLERMLSEHDLAHTIDNELLLVTSTEHAEAILTTRVYAVEDLVLGTPADRAAARAEFGEEPEPDFDELIEVFTSSLAPQSWDDVGGPGSIRAHYYSMSLVVSQTRQVHREIKALLADLREAQARRTRPAVAETTNQTAARPRQASPHADATRRRRASNATWRQLYGIVQPPRADAGGE